MVQVRPHPIVNDEGASNIQTNDLTNSVTLKGILCGACNRVRSEKWTVYTTRFQTYCE